MKNNDEKFSSYFLNEMDDNERLKFEEELKTSIELRNEYENYKKLFDVIQITKSIKLSDEYSQNIIPVFRKKLERKQKFSAMIKFGYVFAVLLAFVVGYSVMDFMIKTNKENPVSFTSITPEEASSFADEMNINFENDYDEQASASIDSLYTTAFNENVKSSIDSKRIQSISKDISIGELDKYLSEDDVNLIFAELSDKEILKR